MYLANPFIYRRKALAEAYCDAVAGRNPLRDARSGLFLAAPRRTGKSTFLRQDMVPAVELRDWYPIYVDLWSDKSRNPAELIAEIITAELEKFAPLPKRAIRAMGFQKIGASGTSIDIGDGKASGGLTIPAALEQLWKKAGKPIVLIIDEAQHALTTDEGQKTLFAIKAARDKLNQEAGKGLRLMLVMTGSSRDKLSFMVTRKSQAFYGAEITHFPLLDDGFVESFARNFNEQFSAQHKFSIEVLKKTFELVGRRPEMFNRVVSEAVMSCHGAEALDAMVMGEAATLQRQAWADFESLYTSLSPTQKAVLDAIARLSPHYEPYSSDAMTAYKAVLGEEPATSSIQGAIKALQERELIWLASRGDYAFDDESLRQWYLTEHPEAPACAKPLRRRIRPAIDLVNGDF